MRRFANPAWWRVAIWRTLVLLVSLGAVAHAAEVSDKPNIVLFFVDDLGWYDLGLRNPAFESPHLDRLARTGLSFEQAYIPTPTCSPSRGALLTGKHPARLRLVRHVPTNKKFGFDEFGRTDEEFHQWPGDPAEFPSRNWLPLEHTTYAEALGGLGYDNLFVGKWHLGHEPYHPIHQGFDTQLETSNWGHPKSYYPPYFKRGERQQQSEGRYLTDKLTDHAVELIENRSDDKPFMLSLWYYNVHAPQIGRRDLVEHFEAKGLSGVAAKYAAKVKAVDESIGRVREALAARGIDKNTVLLFLSDQGSLFSNAPLRGGKVVDTLAEGGARTPFFVLWPGVTDARREHTGVVQSLDLFPTLVEIAGGDPADHQDLDGVSLVSAIKEGAAIPSRSVYGYRAYEDLYATVRREDWKLFAYRSGKTELYNLTDDPREQTDVSAANPQVTRDLVSQLADWERRMGVEPYSGVQ